MVQLNTKWKNTYTYLFKRIKSKDIKTLRENIKNKEKEIYKSVHFKCVKCVGLKGGWHHHLRQE